MLKILKSKWDVGMPLSYAPQTRRLGRYAPAELAKAVGVTEAAVAMLFPQWFSGGLITIDTIGKRNSFKGIKVIGSL